jgi:iron complex transport system ATP-binding protein
VILAARALTVRYPGAAAPAVDRVDAHVGGGELVAVAGPNGSGKSSLLRGLLGLAPGATGAVTLDGRPLGDWSRRAIAGVVGALPQREDAALPLRVREAVLLGRWARLGPIAAPRTADHRAVAEALARCHLAHLAERGVDTLSGGEWQRVRLARALAGEPRLLLLDEPSAALDLAHEMALFELLRHLVADGLGVLVITHHLNLAARVADRVVLLDGGRVAADGPPAAVLQQEVLSRVFAWPVAVTTWCDGAPQVVPLTRAEADASNRPTPPLFHGKP